MNVQTSGTTVFLAILPQVERHALFAFRNVKDPGRFDDSVQETLALCWLWACRLWEKGRDAREFPTTLASFATRHVRSGRSFVGKNHVTKDALSPVAQAMQGFLVKALPSIEAQTGSPWQAALMDNTQSPPDEQAAFRIDFPAFLESLTDRDRRVAEDMMSGDTTRDLAARHRVSPARISQLRREFKDDWEAFTADRM